MSDIQAGTPEPGEDVIKGLSESLTGGAQEQTVRADDAANLAPLYDADAPQFFRFNFKGRGRNANKIYPITITFMPLKDGDYIAYDKQRDVRMAGSTDGVDASNESHTAAVWLGRKLFSKIEGWDPNKLSDARLAGAVMGGLLACDIEPKPAPIEGDAEADKPWDEDDDGGAEPIRLRCIAQGVLITTEHRLGDVSEADIERLRKRYTRLSTKAKLVESSDRLAHRDTKVPSRVEPKGEIYDALGFTATGYKGRVPLHHKEAVVDDFFEVEQELVEGKLHASSPQ